MLRICLYCSRYDFEPLNLMPLGIGYIAAYLIHQGIVSETEICIVDNLDEAMAFRPDILGVSAVSQVIKQARDFAGECKKKLGCLTVLGGYHVTSIPNKLPQEFDVGVIGEGENTFAEIVRLYQTNQLTTKTLKQVKGLCWRQGPEIVMNERRELIENIDSLPWPYRHKEYSKEAPIFTSRGCPYQCIFCASHQFWCDRFRLRSSDSVVAEIHYLVNKYQPRECVILDDLWMANKKRFRECVEKLIELKIPEKVSFRGFCRSNLIREEEIVLLKKMNYRFIRFGAETGSDKLLKYLKGDNISVTDHQRVIDLCQKHNIKCGASFMFGVPGETRGDLEATIHFLHKNVGKFKIIGFYFFNPIPGTTIWNRMKSKGMISDDFQFERLQLDFKKVNFSWDEVMYFNQENVPFDEFRKIIEKIRADFIDIKKPRKKLVWYNRLNRYLAKCLPTR